MNPDVTAFFFNPSLSVFTNSQWFVIEKGDVVSDPVKDDGRAWIMRLDLKGCAAAYSLLAAVEATFHRSNNPLTSTLSGERHITNRKCRDSGLRGQFNRSSRLWEMTVGVGGVCSLTSEVLASLNKGMPPPACLTGEAGSELASRSSGET
ncbi:hypothetical protein J6590_058872 [Homalodisca vitripennis]|nr:hypothetical protein J6590_058872 [Homalodisca vitripennis]